MAQSTATSITGPQSLTLVKNMFRLSVSAVCYLRGIFPPDHFSSRDYAGVTVHQLESAERDDDGNIIVRHKDAFLLTQWLERGVFDALENAYLKTMTFAVYATGKNGQEDVLLETYQFALEYTPEKEVKLNGLTMNRDTLKKQAVTFIRCLIEFTSTLDELPDERFLSMKLTYFDEHTPTDYEPEFFVCANSEVLRFISPPLKIKVGKMETPYHKMQLKFAGIDILQDQGSIGAARDIPYPAVTDHRKSHERGASKGKGQRREEEKERAEAKEEVEEALSRGISALSTAADGQKKRGRDRKVNEASETVAEMAEGTFVSPAVSVRDRVKRFILCQSKASVRESAKALGLDGDQVRAAFASLVEEGTIRHRGRGFEVDHQTQSKNDQEEEEEEEDDDRTVAQEEDTRPCPDATVGTLETQETCESIFTSTPPRVGHKMTTSKTVIARKTEPQQLDFVGLSDEHNKTIPGVDGRNEMSHKRQRVSKQTMQYYYLSQDESALGRKAKCSVIKDPLRQNLKAGTPPTSTE